MRRGEGNKRVRYRLLWAPTASVPGPGGKVNGSDSFLLITTAKDAAALLRVNTCFLAKFHCATLNASVFLMWRRKTPGDEGESNSCAFSSDLLFHNTL